MPKFTNGTVTKPLENKAGTAFERKGKLFL
jgi:hypothetical protein